VSRAVQHVRANFVAYLALFVALGGTSYAAIQLPAGSVGTRQLKNGSITPVKLNGRYFNGTVRAWAVVTPAGKVVGGGGKPVAMITAFSPSTYQVAWGVPLPRKCATVANVDSRDTPPTETVSIPGNPAAQFAAGYAVVSESSGFKGLSTTTLTTFNQSGQPTPMTFDVAVIC
jgi:hypothetical protein